MASGLLFGQCFEDRLLDVQGEKHIEFSKSERVCRGVLASQPQEIASGERHAASKKLIGYTT